MEQALNIAIPLIAGLIGIAYGARLTRDNEARKWLREQRLIHYAQTLDKIQAIEEAFVSLEQAVLNDKKDLIPDKYRAFIAASGNKWNQSTISLIGSHMLNDSLVRYMLICSKRIMLLPELIETTDAKAWNSIQQDAIDLWTLVKVHMHSDMGMHTNSWFHSYKKKSKFILKKAIKRKKSPRVSISGYPSLEELRLLRDIGTQKSTQSE
ncbi:hypothetical protein [Nonomuraea sp. SBT364]|uniref:hypothetical protein n=1 Tax=Nonomuraea sp. SBT364 TaxID=1580530 RepID=UPI0012E30650|nr:hypothetical protein [Nonomuraea sp. SBT364]